jgi:membrane protein implicated in regulation of membrane protease activity
MVYATAWCMQRLAELDHPTLGGLMFCGPGVGIVITGVSAFGMVAAHWLANWGWMTFAVLGAVMLALVWRVFGSPPPALHAPCGSAQLSHRHPRRDSTWKPGR